MKLALEGMPRSTPRAVTVVVGLGIVLALVACGGGTDAVLPASDPAPTISTISPASGPPAGGTAVTLTGTGFLAGATVTFGSAAATAAALVTSTQITATTPAGSAGAVNVTVTNGNGQSARLASGFTYVSQPTLSGISPASGSTAGGTAVTLSGTGFLAGTTITFGSAAATSVVVQSSTQITVLTPAGPAGTVDVVVTNPIGLSATLTSGFTFHAPNPASTLICIPSGALPDGNPLVPYHATLTCSGGTSPYTWSLLSGTLPSGLTLNPTTGLIAGIPSAAAEASLTAEVTDTSTPTPQTAQIAAALNIVTPGASDPELPQVFMATTFPNTAGYIRKSVCALGCNYTDLQPALNNIHADMGDTEGEIIELAKAATFTNNYTLPAYTMAAGKWIIITTKTLSSDLPAQGVRVKPSYSPANGGPLAQILSNNSNPVFQTANNANYYWFMGVEMGVAPSVTENYGIFVVGNGDTSAATLPSWIVLDRCYIHGNATGNIRRGLAANGSYVAAINSYFENFHDTGADTQAIWASNSPGPIKIANNFLEAAGEDVLFGGADPTIPNLVNSDVEIRQNHFFKPLSWKSDNPSYAGILWVVKNILEFKNAQRVLVEGNVLENNWLMGQDGFGVLFTPRNQNGTCAWCTVQSVTFRYNLYQHSGSGFNIAGSDYDYPGTTFPANNISIHDNLILDINGTKWGGAQGMIYEFNTGTTSPATTSPYNITVNHNAGFQTGEISYTGDTLGVPIAGFVFENNIHPATATGGFLGGAVDEGNPVLAAYFTSPVFSNNVIEGGTSSYYPTGIFFPSSWATVDFVDNTNCPASTLTSYNVSICALQSGSPYHNAATDGTDIGPDIGAIDATTVGVAP